MTTLCGAESCLRLIFARQLYLQHFLRIVVGFHEERVELQVGWDVLHAVAVRAVNDLQPSFLPVESQFRNIVTTFKRVYYVTVYAGATVGG